MTARIRRDAVLRALPPGATSLVEAVIASAARAGASLYLVGGPVRDLLLDRAIRDVDLIVEPRSDARPRRGAAPGRGSLAARVARAAAGGDAKVVEYDRFGTVRIQGPDDSIDIATVRSEIYGSPGALPTVGPGSLEEDLLRRDFSINALAIPLSEAAGDQVEVIDLAGGVGDLEKRRLRILHARSFHDDPTRALRAARLAGRLGFSLSRETRNAMRDAQRDGAFGPVSGDRLRREIAKCFSDAVLGLDPAVALRLLSDWHVLPTLEPGLALPREAVVPIRRLGRMLAEPLWRTGRQRPWVSGLALWLAPLDAGLRRRALGRFSVRGDAGNRITDFADSFVRRLDALSGARGRGAIDTQLADIDEETLYALHASAAPTLRRRITRWAVEDRTRRLPVSGNDLLALGLSGSGVGEVLSRLRTAFLDGEVANREEAGALAQELVRQRRQRLKPAAAKAGAGGRSSAKKPKKKSKKPRKKASSRPRDIG